MRRRAIRTATGGAGPPAPAHARRGRAARELERRWRLAGARRPRRLGWWPPLEQLVGSRRWPRRHSHGGHSHGHGGGCCWGWGSFAFGVGVGTVLTAPFWAYPRVYAAPAYAPYAPYPAYPATPPIPPAYPAAYAFAPTWRPTRAPAYPPPPPAASAPRRVRDASADSGAPDSGSGVPRARRFVRACRGSGSGCRGSAASGLRDDHRRGPLGVARLPDRSAPVGLDSDLDPVCLPLGSPAGRAPDPPAARAGPLRASST